MRAVVTLLMFACGCATAAPPIEIDGEQIAPGIHSFDTQRAQLDPALTPWEPAAYYPALSEPGSAPRAARSTLASGPIRAAAWIWFQGYQATLSRIDGTTCRFRPTCSGFGLEAIRDHGLYGLVASFGRLHKNHSYEKHYPMTTPPFLNDPVSNYTFWFRRPRLDDFSAYDNASHAWYQHVRAVKR